MFLGIDCGTQGTKLLLWDADNQQILATSYHPHPLISERPGQKEQDPYSWLSAIKAGMNKILYQAGGAADKIRGIGVSGQQHGLVILDRQDAIIRPAKLWCDTECAPLLEAFLRDYHSTYGQSLSSAIGIQIPAAFTLGKLLWIKEHEPAHFRRIDKILLPHDYLNFILTGEYKTEPGDASGTGYFDTRAKTWCSTVFGFFAPELFKKLPKIINSPEVNGYLSATAAAYLGLPPGILVSSGGGDNMMSAIGTGNIAAGRLTMSLGTSGTLATSQPEQVDSEGFEDINTFCSSTGDWLPLISTMNVTNAINTYRQLMDIDINDFDNYLLASKPGAEGLFSFPWLNGARLPNLPGAQGGISGITMVNFTKPHLLRSVVEGVTFNLCKGIDVFNARGLVFDRISLIGGGAKSSAWCRMIADITGLAVHRPVIPDAAALGAAIQAHWCYCNVSKGSDFIPVSHVMPEMLTAQTGQIIEPNAAHHACYSQIYRDYHAEVDLLKARYMKQASPP